MSSLKNPALQSVFPLPLSGCLTASAASSLPNLSSRRIHAGSGKDAHLSSSCTQFSPVVASHSKTALPGAPIDPILLAPEVCTMLRIGRTTLHKMLKSGELEAPIRVTARIRAWRLSVIEAFIASKEAE